MMIGVTGVQGLRLCTTAFVSWNKMQAGKEPVKVSLRLPSLDL
jgi:hypothetical protein